jgi:hypothetical protein
MSDLSMTDQEAAVLIDALEDSSRRIKVGVNFTYQYNLVESLLQRIETATGKTRQHLKLIDWRIPAAPEVSEVLHDITDELHPTKPNG